MTIRVRLTGQDVGSVLALHHLQPHLANMRKYSQLSNKQNKQNEMKERIKNPWLRWPFPKPKNLEQWWWVFTIGAISVPYLYIVLFSIILKP